MSQYAVQGIAEPSGESDDDGMLPGLRRSVADAQAKARDTRARKAATVVIAETDPIVRVLVDSPLAHLDRTFDYAVPADLDDQVRAGVRVKVRFAGHDADAFVLARGSRTDHTGTLAPLRRVVSAEPVLTTAVAGLVDDVAARYAGVRADVLRLAVPPRHAATERAAPAVSHQGPADWSPDHAVRAWTSYPVAEPFLRHLGAGGRPRAVWAAAPGDDWPMLLAHAAAASAAGGRGALIVVPDVKDVARVDAALSAVLGPDRHVTLTAEAGPAARYRDFLLVSRGHRRVVVGTRAAAFAPVADLGLVAIWDDGDDLHQERRAPYPHARETLLLRAEREGAAALIGGFSRSVEAHYLVRTGWAHELGVPRDLLRRRVEISVAGASDREAERDPGARSARLPSVVHDLVRRSLADGPVLVQTPRAGYALALACERCRTPARCTTCAGPLTLAGPLAPPRCRWCATEAPDWSCGECGARGLRAPVLGDDRTAEELGRSLPGTPVRTSSRGHVLATVGATPALVVATPGAEPVAEDGYAAVVLLDAWLLLGRSSLRAGEEALRRWSNAIALVRPGGHALIVGEPTDPAVQALVRWDHAGHAEREVSERAEAHLPPVSRLATLSGEPGALDDALTLLAVPEHAEVLGPAPLPSPLPGQSGTERIVLRVPRAEGAALSAALLDLQRIRSSRKLDPVRVQVDPPEI